MSDGSNKSPWRSRMAPIELPDTREEVIARLDTLTEIQAHREWVIEGLRAHVRNLEHDLARAVSRVAEIERHAANLERELDGVRTHASNLEALVAEREAHLAAVEEHAENLERRSRLRGVRVAPDGLFPQVAQPRLDALFRLGERTWSERPDLQRRFPIERAPDYWYWLLWHGAASQTEIAAARYPLPERHLIDRIIGEGKSPEECLRSGLVDGRRIDECLREGGFDPARGGSLLDFGAGCGRILSYFALYTGSCQLSGCDVDPEAMAWCERNLDFASFRTLELEPPTPFPSHSFDGIYSFSVFSHLTEALHLSWLEELHRIARPGAVLVLTVHGRPVVEAVTRSGATKLSTANELAHRRAEFERDGFIFVPYRRLNFQSRENVRFFRSWDLERYGDAFVTEQYVRTHWGRLFEVVAYHEAPDDWQDYVVLRRS